MSNEQDNSDHVQAIAQEALIAEALIGDEAKRFLESDLGRCLLGMADQEAEAARIGLETVNPNDTKAVIALQNRAALGRMFKGWLAELYTRGEQSLEVWKHEFGDRRPS